MFFLMQFHVRVVDIGSFSKYAKHVTLPAEGFKESTLKFLFNIYFLCIFNIWTLFTFCQNSDICLFDTRTHGFIGSINGTEER